MSASMTNALMFPFLKGLKFEPLYIPSGIYCGGKRSYREFSIPLFNNIEQLCNKGLFLRHPPQPIEHSTVIGDAWT